jgi:nucleotide-binding universal stress UspA family protein
MLKKILIALDSSKPGLEAQYQAIEMARAYGASVTAVGIIDTPWITAAQPEPLGGSAFKIHRDEAVIRQSHEHVRTLFEEFESSCKSHGIAHTCIEAEGFPSIVIERLAHEHDLIIMGKTTDFHFDLDEDTDITVKHIARDNPRPLIIVPEEPENKGGKILITKDGSVAASRALHMFLLLGLAQRQKMEVLSIHKDGELAQIIAQRGVHMCEIHGVKASSHIIETSSEESDIILERANSIKASMIVMGGFSRSMIKEALFGSCSKRILKDSKIPLFIHH